VKADHIRRRGVTLKEGKDEASDVDGFIVETVSVVALGIETGF